MLASQGRINGLQVSSNFLEIVTKVLFMMVYFLVSTLKNHLELYIS